MIRIFLLCCALLFALMPASAQGDQLPRCNAEQGYDFPGLEPEIHEFERQMDLAESMDDVLRLHGEYLQLRRKLWTDLHLCDVNLESVGLFSARFNDLFAVSALEAISHGQMQGQRWKLVEGMAGEAVGLLLSYVGERFISGLIGGDDMPEDALAACTESQRTHARGAKLKGYIEILDHALAVETVEDLLRYDAAHLTFRESIWLDLPRCANAYEVAILMFRISGDFVVAHALAFLGIPRDANPYVEQLLDDVAGLPSWMIPVALRDVDAVYALFESSLPACTAAELDWALNLRHPLLGPDGELGESFLDDANRSNLKVQAIAEISWRDRHLADSPRCREALEITLALGEVGGDRVAATGFSLAGEAEIAALYREQAQLGAERLKALKADIAAASERSGDLAAEWTHLPDCTGDQLVTVSESEYQHWSELRTVLRAIEVRSDFERYAAVQFRWREDLLQRLPGCAEAVEVGLLYHDGAAILSGLNALGFAAIKLENNPYEKYSADFVSKLTLLQEQMQRTMTAQP